MWTSKLLRSCTASPGKQTAACLPHKEQRWTAARQTQSPARHDTVKSWTLLSGSVARCCLDGGWHSDRVRLCLIQVPGARCLAAAKLIFLRARCSSDPKGNMQHYTSLTHWKALNLHNFWAFLGRCITLIMNVVIVSQNSVRRSSVSNQVWRTIIEQGLWKLLAWFYLNLYFELSMVAYMYMHW